MITISLCMIVKNEENTIGNCLSSVKEAVDEIIIVDTGSTDKTKGIVRKYTDKIYDFTWSDDFAAARNYSFSKATKDYILWLDADDIMNKEDMRKLIQLKKELPIEIDCVHFIYNYAFDESGKPSLVFYRERLVKRERNYQWVGFIHEVISVDGKVLKTDICVTHARVHGAADRNLNIYRRKLQEGMILGPRDQYYYAKELYYHQMVEEAIQELTKCLTMPCWIEDRLDSMYCISDCHLWRKQYKDAREMLYQCFELGEPRAECIYRIGRTFQLEKKYIQAIYWYEQIFHLKKPEDTAGFVYEKYWTWKPHLELCVCYYEIGNREKSIEHNEIAAIFVPNNQSVITNRKFFDSLK